MSTDAKPSKRATRQTDQIGTELLDRQQPWSLDAERGLLGSVLILPEAIDDVQLLLRPDDFFDTGHQTLYRAIVKLYDAGRAVDATLLIDELRRTGELEVIGGMAYLAELGKAVPTPLHAVHYAQIVRRQALKREVICSATDTLQEAMDEATDADTLLARAEERIFALHDGRQAVQVVGVREMLVSALEQIDARQSGQTSGIATGFRDLDALLGGMRESQLLILAARPSMGKTALAMNIAQNVCESAAGVLFVSLEMSRDEMADRMLATMAHVSTHKMHSGRLSSDDRRAITEAAADLMQLPLFVVDKPCQTMSEIAASARRLKRKHDIGLVVVDYLQLIEPANARDPREQQVSQCARRLKMLAKELRVPVLCLSQLNRQAENARDNEPRLSHLRESGAIEQDADVVMFVHREEYFQTNEDDRQKFAGQAKLLIRKQRNGPIGDVLLTWEKELTAFRTAAPANYSNEFDEYNQERDSQREMEF